MASQIIHHHHMMMFLLGLKLPLCSNVSLSFWYNDLNLKSLRASRRIRPSHFLSNPLGLFLRLLWCSNSSIHRHSFPFHLSYVMWSWVCLLLFSLLVATQCCNTVIAILPPQLMTNPILPSPPDLTTDVIRVCYPLNFLIANPLLPSHS